MPGSRPGLPAGVGSRARRDDAGPAPGPTRAAAFREATCRFYIRSAPRPRAASRAPPGGRVALFFLAVDVAAGRPLATPNALGTALFLGEPLDLAREPRLAVVLGYTAVHGAVFIALGCLGAIAVSTARPHVGPTPLALALPAAFFVLCEAVFFGFAGVFGFPAMSALGFGRITLANGLAAAGMGLLLARVVPSGAQRPSGAERPSPRAAARRREDTPPAIDTSAFQSPSSGREGPAHERS